MKLLFGVIITIPLLGQLQVIPDPFPPGSGLTVTKSGGGGAGALTGASNFAPCTGCISFGSGTNGQLNGSANAIYNPSLIPPSRIGVPESSLLPFFQGWTPASTQLVTSLNPTPINGLQLALGVESQGNSGFAVLGFYAAGLQTTAGLTAYGLEGDALATTSVASLWPVNGFAQVDGMSSVATSIHTIQAFVPAFTNGASATSAMQFWSDDLGPVASSVTNPYYSWFDSRGVRRVREDNTFNSVGQAIDALYNPQFTKYTPGAVNFERVILGQWNSNIAEVGTEAGGTGVLRSVRLIGNSVIVPSLSASLPVLTDSGKNLISGTQHGNTTRFQMSDNTGTSGNCAKFDANGNVSDCAGATLSIGTIAITSTVANPFLLPKSSAVAAAPGAGTLNIRAVAGTNAGTCKLVVSAGTSSTEITIVDNIGSGC